MSTYKIHLIKKFSLEWILIIVLGIGFSLAVFHAFTSRPQTVLIGVDQNGTRIITDQEDPVLRTEVINFLRAFVGVMYNFDQTTFVDNAAKASDLLSLDLWNEKKNDVMTMIETMKKEPMQVSTQITKIGKEKNEKNEEQYSVYTNQIVNRRARTDNIKMNYIFTVQKLPKRTKENPYSIEITSIKENRVNE